MNYPGEPQGSQKDVFALAGLLDDDHTAKVHQIWRVLEDDCDLKAVFTPPFPHFSFHVAQSYRLSELDSFLPALTKEIEPFSIRTTGLSVFTGKNPVVFIPVVSSATLISVHRALWENTSNLGIQVNKYYQPGLWVPHITLILQDVNADCLNCIFTQFIDQPFVWEIEITKLAVIYQQGEKYGIHQVYPLGSK